MKSSFGKINLRNNSKHTLILIVYNIAQYKHHVKSRNVFAQMTHLLFSNIIKKIEATSGWVDEYDMCYNSNCL